jgi:pimeloyl-ACP methyl ester carboxylesterase
MRPDGSDPPASSRALAPKPATLVLLPGLDGTKILFRPFVEALPGWITPRIVEYDSSGPNDYEGLLPVVREACAGLEDHFVLGWSFSGPLAMRLAAECRAGLRGVILCGSFLRAPWPMLRWLTFLANGPVARLFPLTSKVLAIAGRYESADLREDKLATWRSMTPKALAERSRAVCRVDARDAARGCGVPLLYVAGSADIVVPRWNAAAVRAAVPGARVVTIRGPHLALRTNPIAAANAIVEFIGDCRRG